MTLVYGTHATGKILWVRFRSGILAGDHIIGDSACVYSRTADFSRAAPAFLNQVEHSKGSYAGFP